ncbi:hypothetical protein ACFL7E_02610 [Thermodesulfobacteriota bacterium]
MKDIIKWIKKDRLMSRWGVDSFELSQIIRSGVLPVYLDFGTFPSKSELEQLRQIKYGEDIQNLSKMRFDYSKTESKERVKYHYSQLSPESFERGGFSDSDLRFNTDDIDRVENEHPHLLKLEEAAFKKGEVEKKGITAATNKEKTTNQDPEAFIRELRLYYVNDNEIKIQETGKEAKPVTCQSLGFRSNLTAEWKALINILQDPPHTYYIGQASASDYDKNRKRLFQINKKLIKYFSKEFGLSATAGLKFFELYKKEGKGVYKPNFQIVHGEKAKSSQEAEYERLSKGEIIDELGKLVEKLNETKTKPDADEIFHKRIVTKIENKIRAASIIAVEKGIPKKDIEDIILPEKEEIKYDPYENQKDIVPDN